MSKLRHVALPITAALSWVAFQLVTSSSGGGVMANGFWTI